jgi:hypothetical protein
MRLRELIRSLVSRWYIVLAGLVLTGAACGLVYNRVPATYEASGSLVLMPPTSTVGETGNPYLYLVGMGQALDVLTMQANAAEVRNPVLSKFNDTGYILEADRSTSGAIVRVKATGHSPDATMGELKAALDTVPATLTAMQDELSIAEHSRITLKTIVVDRKAAKDNKAQAQLLIVAAGAGLVGTVLLSRMLDGVLVARRMARREAVPAPGKALAVPPSRRLRPRRRSPGVPDPAGNRSVPQDSGADEPQVPPEPAKVGTSIP